MEVGSSPVTPSSDTTWTGRNADECSKSVPALDLLLLLPPPSEGAGLHLVFSAVARDREPGVLLRIDGFSSEPPL